MQGLGAAAMQGKGIVAYGSRPLTPAEQRYAQIEKEMLAVVFGCEEFPTLIYGKSDVVIETDHKPLESLQHKPIHKALMRIQRMMLKVQPYTYKLRYTKGANIGLADCLSRLPQKGGTEAKMDEEMMVCQVDTLACSRQDEIARATYADEELQAVGREIF